MYNMETMVSHNVGVYLKFAKRVDRKFPHHTHTYTQVAIMRGGGYVNSFYYGNCFIMYTVNQILGNGDLIKIGIYLRFVRTAAQETQIQEALENVLINASGLRWWSGGSEFTFQCRGCRFSSLLGN